MHKKDAFERHSIVVATPHDLDMLNREGKEKRVFKAPDRKPNGSLNSERIVRAEESRRPVAQLHVELSQGERRHIALYEYDYSGNIEHPEAIRRLLGSLGARGLLAVSRMGGRFLPILDESATGKYCHPAIMSRKVATGEIEAAQVFAIPQPTDYMGDTDLEAINRARRINDRLYRLENYFPSDMAFMDEHQQVIDLPRNIGIDVEYDYGQIGIADGDVGIFASQPAKMEGATEVIDAPENTLIMAHWEALIEGLRVGALSVEDATKMVFPVDIGRLPNGQQGSCFSALGYYSPTTLKRIFYQVKT